jgi:hypothetical protein
MMGRELLTEEYRNLKKLFVPGVGNNIGVIACYSHSFLAGLNLVIKGK